MSLVALALRISAVEATKTAGLFPAGRVFDSNFLPVDDVATDTPEPFVIFSTETATGNPSGRDINTGDRELEFVIEIALTKAIKVDVPDGEDRIEIAMVETDAGLEASMAILERQLMTCLFGRGGGEWGAAFRDLSSQIKETISRRGVSAKEGVRFVARQITYTITPIAEPSFATALDSASPLAEFIALAEGNELIAPIARAMREAIEGKPQDWPAIYSAAALAGGYTDAEGEAIGLSVDHPDTQPANEFTVEDDAGGSFVVDQDAVDEQLPEEPES